MALDFKAIAERLRGDALRYLQEWLPGGKQRGREYVCGDLRGTSGESLSINIDTGVWKDFSAGKGGSDLISLYAAIHDIKQGEAAKAFATDKDQHTEDKYFPGPESGPIPDHSKYGKPEHIAEYRWADGKIAGYICRFPPPTPNDKKQVIPRTAWQRENKSVYWKWKKWPGVSPIYRLPLLQANPDAKVLIVEGERKAEWAQQFMPADWIVVGWCGGAEMVKMTDWTPLKDRYVWIWPDHDEPGMMAAQALKRILPQLFIVDVPEEAEKGWDLGDAPADFDPMPWLQEKTAVKVNAAPIITHQQQMLVLAEMDPANPAKPLGTITNMKAVMDYYRITARYNVISKNVLVHIPGSTYTTENSEACVLAAIYSLMKLWKVPTDNYANFLLNIADMNQYNPVLDWVRSEPWDRVSRLPDFFDTIESPEHEAKELLIRRWMITAISMALNHGIDSAGCLVLQGPQNLGKTWWVKKLAPPNIRNEVIRTDASVDPKDKDSVMQVVSYWICELGEIGATFNKSDLQAVKTFITRDSDIVRKPYSVTNSKYPRRTSLIASVDQFVFLHDTAGDRRFWTIPCTKINSYHDIDMQQVWAEVLHLIEHGGESWQLTPEELAHITRINNNHRQIEPIHEMLYEKFDLSGAEYYTGDGYTATQIAETLGYKNISQKETRSISEFLRKHKIPIKKDGDGIRKFMLGRKICS